MALINLLDDVDLSSRAKRRKAAVLAARLLEHIRDAEEAYLVRIPENLQASVAFDNAEESIGLLADAIDAVYSVYD